VIYHKTEYRERRDHFAYFACSEPLAGFDTQREAFLGPYRGWDNPAVVESGRSANSEAHGWAPHYELHVWLDENPNGIFAEFSPQVSCKYNKPLPARPATMMH